VTSIGSEGTAARQFSWPYATCIYRDRLIVCDTYNARLQFIDISAADAADWEFDEPFGAHGTKRNQLQEPTDLCLAAACCSSLSTVGTECRHSLSL
jgi:hypothetical protein